MKNVCVGLIVLLFATPVMGQMNSTEAMQKLKPLIGEWQGVAESMTGPNEKQVLDQHEKVEYRLDGRIMVIEGKGYQDGKMTFNAFGLVSFDEKTQTYQMKSWLMDGRYTEAYWKENGPDEWEWGFDIEQAGKVRFQLAVNESGQWVEKGHFSPDGQTWYPNFAMTLDKK